MIYEQDNQYINNQIKAHPFLTEKDMMKLCYQITFGPRHILNNQTYAKKELFREFDETICEDTDKTDVLFERISERFIRININVWKAKKIPREWLWRMFFASAQEPTGNTDDFTAMISEVTKIIEREGTSFSKEEWLHEAAEYNMDKLEPIHHSKLYVDNERPHYRVVSSKYIRILPLLECVSSNLNKKMSLVISIDGMAASGKTTIADQISKLMDASIIHMDDFFLPMQLRTAKRLNEPGGNIHYERFKSEVLPELKNGNDFVYRKFDCCHMDYKELVNIVNVPIMIVEGAYSHHKEFGNYMDIRVFCEVGKDEQIKRILLRNGQEMLNNFINKWIPMENKYLEYYKIKENADICL